MLRSIKQLYEDKLGASDGEIGQVEDFYFDDRSWVVRYVIADTGSWLTGRQVLLSPHAFGTLHQKSKILTVNLTKKQIENSPSIESHKTVSRQYEEEYYKYYGWPSYWQGDGLWGMSGLPIVGMSATPLPVKPIPILTSPDTHPETHLRSTHSVDGYHIHSSDGEIGNVADFLIDPKSWAIRQLVIKTGHLFSGKEVEIPTNKIHRISYEEASIFVNLTKEAIERTPSHRLVVENNSK